MSQTQRFSPQVYTYYGLPVFYRVEQRSNGPAVNLSIRIGADPVTARKGETVCKAATWKIPPKGEQDIQQVLSYMVPKLLVKRLPINKKEGRLWRRSGEGCTLGVLWTVDRSMLDNSCGKNPKINELYQEAMAPLLQKYGPTPLKELIPSMMLMGENIALLDDTVIYLLGKLFELEWGALGLNENPWIEIEDYLWEYKLLKELRSLNDKALARRVRNNSDVQWCLSELEDLLTALDIRGEYLNRDEVLSAINQTANSLVEKYHDDPYKVVRVATAMTAAIKTNIQPVVVPQLKFSHWEWNPDAIDFGLGGWVCGSCRQRNDNLPSDPTISPLQWAGSRFCPHCGKKMLPAH